MENIKFNRIDLEKWNRREYFNHYTNEVPCTYSLTVNIDITSLRATIKEMNKKIYPAQIYMIANAVNQHKEFRMATNPQGELGY